MTNVARQSYQQSEPVWSSRSPLTQAPVPASEILTGPPLHDGAAADLRNQVVDRLRWINVKHADHACERRRRDPLGPHALAYFYADPDPDQDRLGHLTYKLRTATRLFLDGPDVADLAGVLEQLTGIADGYLLRGGLDPRRQMADRVEPMSPHACYLGIGVSSLDTPSGPWSRVRARATGLLDVPGRCFAELRDGTMLLLDRHGQDQFGAFHISSTHTLDMMSGQPIRYWRRRPDLAELHDPATRAIWHWLGRLHQVTLRGSDGQ